MHLTACFSCKLAAEAMYCWMICYCSATWILTIQHWLRQWVSLWMACRRARSACPIGEYLNVITAVVIRVKDLLFLLPSAPGLAIVTCKPCLVEKAWAPFCQSRKIVVGFKNLSALLLLNKFSRYAVGQDMAKDMHLRQAIGHPTRFWAFFAFGRLVWGCGWWQNRCLIRLLAPREDRQQTTLLLRLACGHFGLLLEYCRFVSMPGVACHLWWLAWTLLFRQVAVPCYGNEIVTIERFVPKEDMLRPN